MGEIAEMMLGGTCCQMCGEFLHEDDPVGYPVTCGGGGGDELPPRGDGSGKKRRKKRQRQRQRQKRRDRVADELKENGDLWWFLSDHHWRRIVEDENLDYWPSTGCFLYKETIHKGEDVYKFIEEKAMK